MGNLEYRKRIVKTYLNINIFLLYIIQKIDFLNKLNILFDLFINLFMLLICFVIIYIYIILPHIILLYKIFY